MMTPVQASMPQMKLFMTLTFSSSECFCRNKIQRPLELYRTCMESGYIEIVFFFAPGTHSTTYEIKHKCLYKAVTDVLFDYNYVLPDLQITLKMTFKINLEWT